VRREQLAEDDVGQLLKEVEARRPGWEDINDRRPNYKSYWAQWKSLTVRNGLLERH
jgi:hypothetical protein